MWCAPLKYAGRSSTTSARSGAKRLVCGMPIDTPEPGIFGPISSNFVFSTSGEILGFCSQFSSGGQLAVRLGLGEDEADSRVRGAQTRSPEAAVLLRRQAASAQETAL